MWRRNGITCLQCDEVNFKSKLSRLIAFTAPSLREASASPVIAEALALSHYEECQRRSNPTLPSLREASATQQSALPSLRGASATQQSSSFEPVIARSISDEAIQLFPPRHCEEHQPLPSMRGVSATTIQLSRHCEEHQPLPSLRGAQRRRNPIHSSLRGAQRRSNPAIKARFHISLPSLDSCVQLKLSFFF